LALTDEQRAMLQLLLEGGQSYEDIGSLLGIAPDEVRTRARAALQEIAGTDPDAQVGLSDYLLGQADPIGRADAVRQLQSDPETNATAERLVQTLRLLAPKAQLPEIPAPKGGKRVPAPPPPPTASTPPPPGPAPGAAPSPTPSPSGPGFASRAAALLSGLGRGRAGGGNPRVRFLIGLAAALALVVVIVVLTTGGDGSGSDCQPIDTSAAQQAGVPLIKLAAAGAAAEESCKPSGQVTLGEAQQSQSGKNQPRTFILQANAVHLQPTESGERYLLWLYKSDSQALPLGQETVDSSGNLTGGIPLSAEQVVLLPAFDSIRFSRVTSDQAQQLQSSLQAQGKKATGVVPFTGDLVLQGNVSELGLDQILQQAASQARGSTKPG
jgi:hypothetical protein